jgi:hypothetical protein
VDRGPCWGTDNLDARRRTRRRVATELVLCRRLAAGARRRLRAGAAPHSGPPLASSPRYGDRCRGTGAERRIVGDRRRNYRKGLEATHPGAGRPGSGGPPPLDDYHTYSKSVPSQPSRPGRNSGQLDCIRPRVPIRPPTRAARLIETQRRPGSSPADQVSENADLQSARLRPPAASGSAAATGSSSA